MELSIRKICFVGVLTAVICVLSMLVIPTPWGVPFTLQVFGIALCGFTMGAHDGAIVVAVYCALGTIGLPVFSGGQSGMGVLLGPSGGYLMGFLPLAVFCGLSNRTKRKISKITLVAIGIVLCHALGIFQLDAVTGIGYAAAMLSGSLPYLAKDAILIIASYYVSRKLRFLFPICNSD